MTLKYCEGNPRSAESLFGWGRQTVALGLAATQTGRVCVGAQSGFGGNHKWEERYPDAAATLVNIAEAQSQQEPSFTTSIADTRLTAPAALRQLQTQGVPKEPLPARSAMAVILNRLSDRLRCVVQAKPKKLPETDLLFENLQAKDQQAQSQNAVCLSLSAVGGF